MLSLATTYEKGFIRLKDVAIQENISEKYLESIVATIKPLGIIDVRRGSSGGYKLAIPPSQIQIKDLFEVLDGSFINEDPSVRTRENETYNQQVVDDLWNGLKSTVITYLSSISLNDLLNDYNKKNNNPMYYI